jgi:hypothetical protein
VFRLVEVRSDSRSSVDKNIDGDQPDDTGDRDC